MITATAEMMSAALAGEKQARLTSPTCRPAAASRAPARPPARPPTAVPRSHFCAAQPLLPPLPTRFAGRAFLYLLARRAFAEDLAEVKFQWPGAGPRQSGDHHLPDRRPPNGACHAPQHRTPGQVARAKQLRWRAERGGCWLAKSRGAEDALVRDQADAQKEEHAGPKEEGARQSLLQVCRGCAL